MVIPEIRNIDQNHVVATWDCVLLQLWRGEATARAMQGLREAGRALLAAHPGRACCSLSIIEPSSPPPSDHVRPVLSAVYRELGPGMRHQLFVAEGSGFRSALVRGVGLAVSALAPSLLPFKFASSIVDAAETIVPSLSARSGGAPALLEAVSFLRTRLDEQAVQAQFRV
jgi:hypothetical protein